MPAFLLAEVVNLTVLMRKPERWDDLDPWSALAMAVTMQAYQDLARGALHARVILQGGRAARKALKGFRACRAVTAAEFFLSSPIWQAVVGSRQRRVPKRIEGDVDDVLRAQRLIEGKGGRKAC